MSEESEAMELEELAQAKAMLSTAARRYKKAMAASGDDGELVVMTLSGLGDEGKQLPEHIRQEMSIDAACHGMRMAYEKDGPNVFRSKS